jgi:hypothetical protein
VIVTGHFTHGHPARDIRGRVFKLVIPWEKGYELFVRKLKSEGKY